MQFSQIQCSVWAAIAGVPPLLQQRLIDHRSKSNANKNNHHQLDIDYNIQCNNRVLPLKQICTFLQPNYSSELTFCIFILSRIQFVLAYGPIGTPSQPALYSDPTQKQANDSSNSIWSAPGVGFSLISFSKLLFWFIL